MDVPSLGVIDMNKSDQKIIAMLYRMVNECNANHAPMCALYSELSEMIQHGATNERVDALMAQIDGKREVSI
jgi:hypothetical protein